MKKTLIIAATLSLMASASAATITADTTPVYSSDSSSSYGIDVGIWESGADIASSQFTYTLLLNPEYFEENNDVRIAQLTCKTSDGNTTRTFGVAYSEIIAPATK